MQSTNTFLIFLGIYNDKCGMEWEYDGNPDPQVGSCYLFRYTDYKFWDDAMYQCRIEGGDLASVSGYDAQLFLQCKFISLFLC